MPPYDPNAKVMTQAEVDAWYASRDQRRAQRKAARERRALESAERGPRPADLLAALAVGESVLLPGYRATTQTSSSLRSAYIKTGFRFSSKLAHDLLTGETVIGVTVTRVS